MFLRLIKLLISLVVALVDWISACIRYLLNAQPLTQCVVIYYHTLPTIARRQFASQMDELLRLSIPIDIEGSERLPDGHRYSAVTFDDAFMSVIDNALPELLLRKIPCMIFVPSGSMGGHPTWIESTHQDATEVVASPEALRTIINPPLVRIGSHSVSHPDFRRLDDEQTKSELTQSKAMLEEILGQEVHSFSFPHGAYTQRTLDLARACGYKHVFTINPTQKAIYNRFAIGRVRVEPCDWPIEFRLKVLGAYRWMTQASVLKRSLLGVVRGGRVLLPQPRQGH